MKPLTTQQLIEKARQHQPVYFCWFYPEVEGQPETAWRIRSQGFSEVFAQARTKSLQAKHGTHLIDVCRFSFNSNVSVEEGLEIDGHGFIYFFNDAKEVDQYVAERKQKFAEESALLVEAIHRTLGSNVQIG
jgi:hypothetical protein